MAPFQATSTANVTIDCKAAEVHHHVTRSNDAIASRSCLRESAMRDKREPGAADTSCTCTLCAPPRRHAAPRFRAGGHSCIKRRGMDAHSMRVPFFAASTVIARHLVPPHVA
jgi:hypothetical protein